MVVTRCQENTGFLVLHRCENVAEFKCVSCGRMICAEHGRPVDAPPEQAAAQPSAMPAGAMAPPPPPAGAVQNYACQTCLKNRQPQQQQTEQQQGVGAGYYGDPYYHYPYYGSYRPYHSGYYYDYNDRSAFDRDRGTPADTTDALGS
ncbi:MAG: hypothetical protein ACYDCO_25125 [Armatimonadota bacterium]